MEFLAPESTLNLFIIGDIESFGFGADFQEVWGDFDASGRLRAVLLRYYGSFIPYAPGDFDVEGIVDILRSNLTKMEALSGIERVMCRLEAYPDILPKGALRRTLRFAELRSLTMSARAGGEGPGAVPPAVEAGRETEDLHGPLRATHDDIRDFLSLWSEIPEFSTGEDSAERNRREMESGASRVYLYRLDRLGTGGASGRPGGRGGPGGRVVASAKTTAENSLSAMVVGVATHPEHRRRGLATRLVTHLCRELLAEGKRPCLFYDNPEAAGIYRRLGFADIGIWVMYLP